MAATGNREFTSQIIKTHRLNLNVWTSGPEDGTPLLLVHGNLTTGGFWRYVAAHLPDDVRVVAPDMRGFGRTERKPINATRGLGQMVDDIRALLEKLQLTGQGGINAAGWSMGGGILQQYLLTYPEDLSSMVLIAPLSPYGFGGTKDERGTPCWGDYAGSGAGGAAARVVERIAARDTSSDEPSTTPREVFLRFFGPVENAPHVDVDFLLDQVLMTATGDDFYPGDATESTHWPSVAPGERGVLNSMSPKYFNASAITTVEPKPPITWVRGGKDEVISDTSMSDLAMLGSVGILPDWPGPVVMPPQPMEAQTRAVLQQYAEAGGFAREVVIADAAHGLPVQVPEQIAQIIAGALVR